MRFRNITTIFPVRTQRIFFVLTFFLLSTFFFLYQHARSFSWDFAVYVLNAQYWSGQGIYYELIRPPLASLLLLFFSPLGWKAAEYFYIILVSAFFYYATRKLAHAAHINSTLFYIFLLTPYALLYGTFAGAELLSLALLELFFASLLTYRQASGLWLGLSCLARYNSFIYIPFLFFEKNAKQIILNLSFFTLSLLPWFFYNYFTHGNFFASIVNKYALNVLFRGDLTQPFNSFDFLLVASYLTPLFFIGVIQFFYRGKLLLTHRVPFLTFLTQERAPLLMLLFFILSFYHYLQILRDIRFLYPIILPIAYFSVLSVARLRTILQTLFQRVSLLILLLTLLIFLPDSFLYTPREPYTTAFTYLQEHNLSQCRLYSNEWIYLTSLGKITEPNPRKELLAHYIQTNNLILFFPSSREPDWVANTTFLRTYPVLAETDYFILLGRLHACNPIKPVTTTYLEELHESLLLRDNIDININPCFLLFKRIPFLEKSCNFINFHGFILDKNRMSA